MASRRSTSRNAVAPGLLLLLGGVWQAAGGVAAIADGGYFVAPAGYAFAFSIAAWGWVHLIVGASAVAVAVGVLRGSALARILGLALASASLISNFLWLPIEPGWSIAVIGVDVFVIWALATTGDRPLTAAFKETDRDGGAHRSCR